MLRRRISLALFAMPLFASLMFAAPPDGAALYKTRCAICHDGKPQQHMPSHDELVAKTPEAIVRAMLEGAMMPQSTGLNEEEARAIAKFITGKEMAAVSTAPMPISAPSGARMTG